MTKELRSLRSTAKRCGASHRLTNDYDRVAQSQKAVSTMTLNDYRRLLRSRGQQYKSPRRISVFLHFDLLFDSSDSCTYNSAIQYLTFLSLLLLSPIITEQSLDLFTSSQEASSQAKRTFLTKTHTSHNETIRLSHLHITNPFRPSIQRTSINGSRILSTTSSLRFH